MAQYVVGIDLGGTKMRAGIVSLDEPDRVVSSGSTKTVRGDPEKGILALVVLVQELMEEAAQHRNTSLNKKTPLHRKTASSAAPGTLVAAGIGAPGPFDQSKQAFTAFANLPAWTGFPLGTRLSSALKVPVAMGNDANVAAIGEHRAGAGKGMKDLIYVTLGTGVGGAVIVGGQIHASRTGIAGEFGHVQVDPEGELCGCGKRGCLETIASGTGIVRMYGAPARAAFRRAARGEEKAVRVLQRAGEALGAGLSSAAIAVDPEAVIVGGGLASGEPRAVRILLEAAKASLWQRMRMPGFSPIPFVKGALGDDAGILGAAHIATELR